MLTRSIQFWDDVNDAIVKEAEERRVSINWLVNQILKEGLERLDPEFRVTS